MLLGGDQRGNKWLHSGSTHQPDHELLQISAPLSLHIAEVYLCVHYLQQGSYVELDTMGLQLILFLGCGSLVMSLVTDIDQSRYDEGRRQFELMQKQSEMPKYGQCWIKAMAIIRSGCKHLTDDSQTRLALAYLNCFLILQGRSSYYCSEEDEVKHCVKDMEEADRSSFTTFFTHTQNICYFLQAQVWHEHTEQTISRLSDSSSQVAEQLETAQELQKGMLLTQSQSLENQERLMNQTVNLNSIINSSSKTVQVLFEDLKKSTQEQREVIQDLFGQLSKLQSTILGEVSSFYSLFFYVLSIIVCYLLTSTPRTAGARVWLFLVMTISFVAEQTLLPWLSQVLTVFGSQPDGNEQIYWLQKICRRLFILIALTILALCVFMYKDINAINNQLLLEIKKQNSDIRRSLTVQKQQALPVELEPSQSMNSDSDYTSGESDAESNDGSDKTYILPENAVESDAESYMTLQGDADSTADQTSLLCELYDLQKSPQDQDFSSKVDSWLEKTISAGSNFRTPTSPTPNQGSPYNLRPRGSRDSPNISPASQVESVKSFSKTVRQMQEISEKNSRLIRAYQQCNVSGVVPRNADKSWGLSPQLQHQSSDTGGLSLLASPTTRVKDVESSSIVTRSSTGSLKKRLLI
ncbi:U3 small nucleolar ribonucleoprotein protein imp4-like [Plakobranchus ocellatus]|uniref:U3 small nucleolar ribonucleoprotein protein imp4-like n=1 Tax=Plakobranchus ocellatus TaxID=259542 RepID=A0AAV3YQ53_9GAST|nr:U3 small nucleolar ribonucleoprotein protein imp4-like [Plakobranchus ocellatus]